jgi:hypothetical protein
MQDFVLADGRHCLVRNMAEQDLPRIMACVNSVAGERIYIANEGITDPERFRMHIWDPIEAGNNIALIAEVGPQIVGNLNLQIGVPSKRSHTAYVFRIVLKGFRGMGIGTEMMGLAAEMARERGVERLHLSVFSSNTRAIGFYGRLGFETEGVLKKQFVIDGKYVDEVHMAMWLD